MQDFLRNQMLADRAYFHASFDGQLPLAAELLEAITGKPDILLTALNTDVRLSQAEAGAEVWLDLAAWAADNTLYGVKLLRDWTDMPMNKALSVLDTMGLCALGDREDAENPEVWCIFLGAADSTGSGEMLHHEKMGQVFGSERYLRHIVYLNCAYERQVD